MNDDAVRVSAQELESRSHAPSAFSACRHPWSTSDTDPSAIGPVIGLSANPPDQSSSPFTRILHGTFRSRYPRFRGVVVTTSALLLTTAGLSVPFYRRGESSVSASFGRLPFFRDKTPGVSNPSSSRRVPGRQHTPDERRSVLRPVRHTSDYRSDTRERRARDDSGSDSSSKIR